METFTKILDFLGYPATIIVTVSVVWAGISWLRGILPVLWRLGSGLATRKIAIFAKGDNLESLKHLLLDSKLFREKNIIEVRKLEDIDRADPATVYLVFWSDWAADVAEILRKKPDACALVVYAPYNEARIPNEQMIQLDGKRHTAVTNFRGRLLNDIVTSMITTSYEKA